MEPPEDAVAWSLTRRRVLRDSIAVGLATGAYGIGFGVVSAAGGLDVAQTMALSLLMFTGASQFAFVGVVAGGGSPASAAATAVMLGTRNAFYGLSMARLLRASGVRRLAAAQITIDESTGMALGHEAEGPRAARLGFWATGIAVFVLWNLATLLGAVGASSFGDVRAIGLDAAVPAAFLALLWPRLRDRDTVALALSAAAVAVLLTPVLRPGLPVLAAAAVALAWAARPSRADEVST